jgi:IS30 family transposase
MSLQRNRRDLTPKSTRSFAEGSARTWRLREALIICKRTRPVLVLHERKSITFDNDTAFAQHGLLRTMRAMTTWFCDAYASWQKGGVENDNGRLRRWLPRHTDIDKVSDEEIQDIVLTTNLTPRKCLGFKTPFQAILKELGKGVQIRFS